MLLFLIEVEDIKKITKSRLRFHKLSRFLRNNTFFNSS